MFVNSLTATCQKLEKIEATDGYDRKGWLPKGDEIICLFTIETGRTVLDSAGVETVIDAAVFTEEEVLITERLAYEGYMWKLVSVRSLVDPMTTQVYGYKSYVSRRREYYEQPISISPVTE